MGEDRSQLMKNAIQFLQDPAVQKSSRARQVAFLEGKGLVEEEIREAFRQADVPAAQHSPPPIPSVPPSQALISKPPPGFRWSNLVIFVALAGTAGLALSRTILSRLLKRWASMFGSVDNKDEDQVAVRAQLDAILSKISKLESSQCDMETRLQSVSKQLLSDVEGLKSNQQYFYSQFERDLVELREDVLSRLRQDACRPDEGRPVPLNELSTQCKQ